MKLKIKPATRKPKKPPVSMGTAVSIHSSTSRRYESRDDDSGFLTACLVGSMLSDSSSDSSDFSSSSDSGFDGGGGDFGGGGASGDW